MTPTQAHIITAILLILPALFYLSLAAWDGIKNRSKRRASKAWRDFEKSIDWDYRPLEIHDPYRALKESESRNAAGTTYYRKDGSPYWSPPR